jgi:UDP:flavonoid glycosyltransferase YjiC (YdhE family)
MPRVDLAWELGAHTGHVTTLMPIARALRNRGHEVRFFLKDEHAGSDLAGIEAFPREGAPNWVGPPVYADPLNFGQILHNFAYHDPVVLKRLVDAWRERLWLSQLVLASFAPAAVIAARTLGIPAFEISQGFYVPPATMPAPPLRDWQPAPRALLEEGDQRIVASINAVYRAYGVDPIATIGGLFTGRAMLLTYPEMDTYPQRGPADYYGVPESGEGPALPSWPSGRGPRVFAYLYNYYKGLPRLVEALASLDAPTLMLCRAVDPAVKRSTQGTSVYISDDPMAVSRVLPGCDMVLCHGSHQMTAQALLAGKPLLLVPTQLEQFLTTRRVVRFGAGLGIAPEVHDADFRAALGTLSEPSYAGRAREFAARYGGHDRGEALATMVRRCEDAIARGAQGPANSGGHESAAKTDS